MTAPEGIAIIADAPAPCIAVFSTLTAISANLVARPDTSAMAWRASGTGQIWLDGTAMPMQSPTP